MHRLLNPWNYSYIRLLADEATTLARIQGLRPVLAHEITRSFKTSGRLNIPFLGDHVPEGWELVPDVEPVFVVIGRGIYGDLITPFEFVRRLEEDGSKYGYGVIERGQVQALVAAYQRKEINATDQETES
jgi:hypothetical protein